MQLFEYVRVKYAVYTNNCLQVDTVGFQHPLLRIGARSYATIWFDGHPVLFCQEDSFDQADGGEHRVLQLSEEDIFFNCVQAIIFLISPSQLRTRQRITNFSELSSLQITKRSILKLSAVRLAT
jgi:hypothetical protein